jgi:hypothetical protein
MFGMPNLTTLKINLYNRHFVVVVDDRSVFEVMEDDAAGRAVCDSVEEPHIWATIRAMTGLSWAIGPVA